MSITIGCADAALIFHQEEFDVSNESDRAMRDAAMARGIADDAECRQRAADWARAVEAGAPAARQDAATLASEEGPAIPGTIGSGRKFATDEGKK